MFQLKSISTVRSVFFQMMLLILLLVELQVDEESTILNNLDLTTFPQLNYLMHCQHMEADESSCCLQMMQ